MLTEIVDETEPTPSTFDRRDVVTALLAAFAGLFALPNGGRNVLAATSGEAPEPDDLPAPATYRHEVPYSVREVNPDNAYMPGRVVVEEVDGAFRARRLAILAARSGREAMIWYAYIAHESERTGFVHGAYAKEPWQQRFAAFAPGVTEEQFAWIEREAADEVVQEWASAPQFIASTGELMAFAAGRRGMAGLVPPAKALHAAGLRECARRDAAYRVWEREADEGRHLAAMRALGLELDPLP